MNCGAGPFLSNGPAHCGCLRYTPPAPDGGTPGPAVTSDSNQAIRASTGRWDPAIIGSTFAVAVGQATTMPPARHSTRLRAGWVRLWSCGVWPVILRHRGRGHGRSPDHRPLGGCSSPRGWGEAHKSDETASSMKLIY